MIDNSLFDVFLFQIRPAVNTDVFKFDSFEVMNGYVFG